MRQRPQPHAQHPPSLLYSATHKTLAPCWRDECREEGGGHNLHSPVFDVAGIKANPQPGRLQGHLSAPMVSPMAGLSVMVRLVPLPGAQGYGWDESLG